jgi:hypothetical protein
MKRIEEKLSLINEELVLKAKNASWELIRRVDNRDLSAKGSDEHKRIEVVLDEIIDDLEKANHRLEYLNAQWKNVANGRIKL